MKKWFKLNRHPILYPLVELITQTKCTHAIFDNKGKFKPGDKVRYNLFAKIIIGSAVSGKGYKTHIIKEYPEWSKSKSNVYFTDGDGCDVFWLRKIYPWEK